MKKIFAVLIGLMLSSAAFACNSNTENCSFNTLEASKRYVEKLMKIPGFVGSKDHNDLVDRAKYTDGKIASCSNWKCVNQTAMGYLNFVSVMERDYVATPAKATAAPVAVAVQDKWADQCVYVEKANVAKFNDGAGAQQAGVLKQYSTYTVAQVNGGKLVGLGTDGKFVGWAKKTELQMQDLRNCNM